MLASDEVGRSASRKIGPEDMVIAMLWPDAMKAVSVADAKFSNVAGTYCPQDWVGKLYGSCVYPTMGHNNVHRLGPMYLLPPTPELWTRVLKHRTQILYLPDISMVCTFLELKPGCVVVESGTGSGSMSHSIARAIYPSGHLYTFEYHAERAQAAQEEFESNGMGSVVTVTERDIEANGFPESCHGKVDGLFLDLPGPWKVVASAAKCLKGGGRFCSFSPCIEQIQKTADELEKHGFANLRTMECLLREYSVRMDSLITDLEGYQKAQEESRAWKIQCKKRPRCPTPKTAAAAAADSGAPSTVRNQKEQGVGDEAMELDGNVKETPAATAVHLDSAPAPPPKQDPISLPKVNSMKGHTGYLLFARRFVEM